MRILAFLSSVALLAAACSNQPEDADSSSSPPAAVEYDPELARSLGADEYGMRSYVMAFPKAGPNRGQDPAEVERLQRAHLENINRLAEAGKLSLAGPFLDGGDLRGIYVFNVETVEEARELTASDPAIKAGRLIMELHPWYGSAALMQVNEVHETLARKQP